MEYPTFKSYESLEPREGCFERIDTKDFLDDNAAHLFTLRRDKKEVKNKFNCLKLKVDFRTGAKESTLKEITHLESDLAEITKIKKDFPKGCRYECLRDSVQIYLREKYNSSSVF